mmetsp:Transcript_2002/g.4126  ORF Transcript_2002/g.4126 Transcript_2002/m.4126 type:complete len:144 (+) Transcript_2002:1351-1782(+)
MEKVGGILCIKTHSCSGIQRQPKGNVQSLLQKISAHFSKSNSLSPNLYAHITVICKLWGKTSWISWEHGRFPNIIQATEEHDNSFEANTSASVRICSTFECIKIRLYLVDRNTVLFCPFPEQIGIVNSLCSGDDFLAPNEHIK